MSSVKTSILVVEDDVAIAELVKDLLNDEFNFHAVTVDNGATAIELLNKIKIDLLILDIGLPGISGIQIYDWLQTNHKLENTPVIFMTAQTAKFKSELEKRNIVNIIQKPFDLDEFLVAVQEALSDFRKAEARGNEPQQIRKGATRRHNSNLTLLNHKRDEDTPQQDHLKSSH